MRRRGAKLSWVFLSAAVLGGVCWGPCGCAARRPRSFAPAGEAVVVRALEAWRQAVVRAESLPPSRLLYEARLTQGLARMPGTLAVKESAHLVEASLTGPFGSPVATYTNGALRGEGLRPVSVSPEELRALLAGAWKRATPRIAGVDGGDALLVWEEEERVEGVLDLSLARFRSLAMQRPEGRIVANYSGEFNPWPSRIEVRDLATNGQLRLTLLTHEPVGGESGPASGEPEGRGRDTSSDSIERLVLP